MNHHTSDAARAGRACTVTGAKWDCCRLSEVFEKETEAYFKMDPDPMDDRHPGKGFMFLFARGLCSC